MEMTSPRNVTDATKPHYRFQDTYVRRLAKIFRRRRFRFIRSLILALPRPLTILDVGGTGFFWEQVGFTGYADVRIVLLNLEKEPVAHPNFSSVVGDGRDMQCYGDKQFDVVFSNSVIEHMGGYEQQRQMAREVRRVGRRYCVQTPNRYFPVEPHFLIPWLQFYPMWLKVLATRYIDVGAVGRLLDRRVAEECLSQLRLLTAEELRDLFPGARVYKERVCGLIKSFTVYDGWDRQEGPLSPSKRLGNAMPSDRQGKTQTM